VSDSILFPYGVHVAAVTSPLAILVIAQDDPLAVIPAGVAVGVAGPAVAVETAVPVGTGVGVLKHDASMREQGITPCAHTVGVSVGISACAAAASSRLLHHNQCHDRLIEWYSRRWRAEHKGLRLNLRIHEGPHERSRRACRVWNLCAPLEK